MVFYGTFDKPPKYERNLENPVAKLEEKNSEKDLCVKIEGEEKE